MPQEHYVLRCFSCETFQAHIVKKAKKWECKMCGAKQSVKRNYGKGSGKDCRNQVKKLNELRLTNDMSNGDISVEAEDGNDENGEEQILDDDCILSELKQESDPNKPVTSKWAKYLDEPIKDTESDVEDCLTDFYNDSEENKKRVKRMSDGLSNKNKKFCEDFDPSDVPSPVTSLLFSPPSDDKKTESCKLNEKATKKNSFIQGQNKLKSNKYTKYLNDDTDDCDNGDTEIRKEKDIRKLPNIFESDTNDLNNLLSLE